MYLDLKKLFSGEEEKQHISFETSFEGEKLPSGAVFAGPAKIVFDTQREYGAVRCDVLCTVECARCLEPFTSPLHAERIFYLKENDASNEEDLPMTGDGVDLKELARQELFLAAPMVLYCREDCPGLCPVCGKPKKLGCTCESPAVDERLQILKQLLQ